MTTKVIHIKNSTKAADEIYIGRSGKGVVGKWGNPIVKNQKCMICDNIHIMAGDTLPCYKQYLNNMLKYDEEFEIEFNRLKDKTLVCFCAPNPCHGEIMAEILDVNTKN